jgi:quercetin dioxygenase-like cupin family protein
VETDLNYQAGGIVSRILLKQASGSVTGFAFDAGQELSEHTCPFDALLHVIDGQASVSIGGTTHFVECGQIIKLPAHVPHGVQAPRRFKMLLTMLRAAEG